MDQGIQDRRALWRDPALRAITVATGVAYLGIGGLTVTAVGLATTWHEPGYGGFLTTAFAAGAMLAAFAIVRRPVAPSPLQVARICLLFTGFALADAAFLPFAACLVLFAAAGAGDGPLLGATLQLRADHAPEPIRAQVFTTGAAIKLSAASLGAMLAGLLSASPTMVLVGIAACHILGGVLLSAMTRDQPVAVTTSR